MSASLYWRITPKSPEGKHFGYDLKWALAHRYFDHDGSLNTDWFTLDKNSIPFLEGVEVAGSEGAQKEARKLIDLIEKYGEVDLCLRS